MNPKTALLEKMRRILQIPELELPRALEEELASRIVAMSMAWAEASRQQRPRVLADHRRAIVEWAREHRFERAPAHGEALQTWSRHSQDLATLPRDVFVGSEKRKQSLYFPESMLEEIRSEASRLDRSLSWVVQRAWKLARVDIGRIPGANVDDEDELVLRAEYQKARER